MLTPDNAVRVLAAGGGLIVSAKSFTPDHLVRMASVANAAGGTLTIMDAASSMIPDAMVRIGEAGRRHIIFDVSD